MVITPEYLALVMEFIRGGNLLNYIRAHPATRLCEFQARWFFQQLCIGVDYMHRRVRRAPAQCSGLTLSAWPGVTYYQEWPLALRCQCHTSVRNGAPTVGVQNIANRDLKLENLLLDRDGKDGTRPLLKICDFGFSKHAYDSPAKSTVGTLVYSAPEVFLGAKYDAKVRNAGQWALAQG